MFYVTHRNRPLRPKKHFKGFLHRAKNCKQLSEPFGIRLTAITWQTFAAGNETKNEEWHIQPSSILFLLHEIFPPNPDTPLKFQGLQMQRIFPEKIPASIAAYTPLMMHLGDESTFGCWISKYACFNPHFQQACRASKFSLSFLKLHWNLWKLQCDSSPRPPNSKLLLIIMRWQVNRLARLIGKVVRISIRGPSDELHPVWAKQLTRLTCLVVNAKFQFRYRFNNFIFVLFFAHFYVKEIWFNLPFGGYRILVCYRVSTVFRNVTAKKWH